MNCTTGVPETSLATALGAITFPHHPLIGYLRPDEIELLRVVRQLGPAVQWGEWEALKLGRYFGPYSQSVQFKEVLVPFVWTARQQVIQQVGAGYRQFSLAERAQRELALLVQLDQVVKDELRQLNHPSLSRIEDLSETVFRLVLSVVFVQHPKILATLVAITVNWIDSTLKLIHP